MTRSRDRIVGCLVGGAIGDVLGGVPERGRLSLSDDTQLTLATCEAIESSGGVRPQVVADTFLRWYQEGSFSGLGSSTTKALRDLSAGAHWALAGARGEMAAGNGAAMRIAPLAFVLDPFDTEYRTLIRDVCRITHHSDEAYIGALAVLLAICLPTWPPGNVYFSDLVTALPDSRVRDRLVCFAELPVETPLSKVVGQFGSSGYVVETVPLALFIAARVTSASFASALAELAECGDDADTIGSIAGQVAFSHLGAPAIPESLASLAPVRDVVPLAERFARITLGAT